MIGGTKLYASTLVTLRAVFSSVDVYPVDEQEGQMIVMASMATASEPEMLLRRARALQEHYQFRYPLPGLVAQRRDVHDVPEGELLTDDFAPVNLYETTAGALRPR